MVLDHVAWGWAPARSRPVPAPAPVCMPRDCGPGRRRACWWVVALSLLSACTHMAWPPSPRELHLTPHRMAPGAPPQTKALHTGVAELAGLPKLRVSYDEQLDTEESLTEKRVEEGSAEVLADLRLQVQAGLPERWTSPRVVELALSTQRIVQESGPGPVVGAVAMRQLQALAALPVWTGKGMAGHSWEGLWRQITLLCGLLEHSVGAFSVQVCGCGGLAVREAIPRQSPEVRGLQRGCAAAVRKALTAEH